MTVILNKSQNHNHYLRVHLMNKQTYIKIQLGRQIIFFVEIFYETLVLFRRKFSNYFFDNLASKNQNKQTQTLRQTTP